MKKQHEVLFVNGRFGTIGTLYEVTAPKEKHYITSADYRTYSDIYTAYGKPSVYKVRAWGYCKELCKALNGENLRITSRNCMKFSVKFDFAHPENGACCVAYITADYNRFAYC